MNDTLLVGRRQSMSDLDGIVDGFANRQGAALQHLTERASFQELGNQIRSAFKDAKLVDGKNIGMIEGCSRLRFLFKAMQPVWITRNEGRQNLDCYFAL